MSENLIHIAMAVHDKTGEYVTHTATTLVSVFMHTQARIQVHLLHDDTLRAVDKEKLTSLCQKYGQQIKFYQVNVNLSHKWPLLKKVSPGSLFRLLLPDVLLNIDRVIYLDSDLIFMLDILPLWLWDIRQGLLGAVKDVLAYDENVKKDLLRHNRFYRQVPLLSHDYFNAGLLVLDLHGLRTSSRNYVQEFLAFLNTYEGIPLLDQDALNFVLKGQCIFLPLFYNQIPGRMEAAALRQEKWEGAVWHFSLTKPWEVNGGTIDELYWRYFHLTPWGSDSDNLIRHMLKVQPVVEEALLTGKIIQRYKFIKNFWRRFWREIHLKLLK